MNDKVQISEIQEKTPFTEHMRGRSLPTSHIYDPNYENENLPDYMSDEDWIMFVPDDEGNLQFLRGSPITVGYFGKEPENPERDVHIEFVDLYYQRLSWPDIMGLFPHFIDDLRNILTTLSTLAIYQSSSSELGFGLQRLIQTELEYLFFVSRSVYDGLQFIISNTWDKISSTDEDKDFSAQLPTSSFKDMALDGNDPISPDVLVEKYGIPAGLAEFYSEEATVFKKLRNFRDAVVHLGESPDIIFSTEDGIAVDTTSQPYSDFDAWDNNQIIQNDLAPLWPFVAHIVDHVFSALDNFIAGFLDQPLHLPYELAEGYDVYLRGPHIANLKHIDQLQTSDAWGSEFVDSIHDRVSEEFLENP